MAAYNVAFRIRRCMALAFIALTTAAPHSIFAKEAAALSLSPEEAVKYALDGNINIKREKISLGSAKRTSGTSWNKFIPSINASGTMTGGDNIDDPTLSAGASLSLGLTPSVYTAIRSASLSYQKQQIDYDTAVRTIELNVRKAYYNLLYEKENLNLMQANLSTAQRQYNSNAARYNRGALARLDVLSAQVSWQNAQVAYEKAQITLETDMDSFKQILGIAQETQIELTGSLDKFISMGEIKKEDTQKSKVTPPEIASLEKQVEIARNNLLASRFNAWGPTVTGSYSYTMNGTLDTGIDTDSGTKRWTLGVTIPLDGFIPFSQRAVAISAQKDSLESLELALENAKSTFSTNVDSALRKIKYSQSVIKLRQSSVNLAAQTYSMSLDAYNRGSKDLLSLQTALDNLTQAKVNLQAEAYNLICNILDLENTLGVPFGTLIK
ncbi:MAG: TolC family protein [Treponema sp.]|nr:TolC family protein [Treponema sp.]MBQ1670365.1 TolC family protein [Treponema sp.]MBQ2547985.1 TolC family protein [Treponema sp.]MBQ3648627.1 TolC family protein [Treponema sp.]MBQ5568914.1 TolC family protein [Treponema sp.]